MNLAKSTRVDDRRRVRTGNAITVGGNLGKGKSVLAPVTSKVDSFVKGFTGTRVF